MIRVFLFSLVLLLPTVALAATTMTTFQDVPLWNNASDSASIIEALYKIAIGAAAILVVFRLMMAGVQYMFSEMITSKQKAKETIQSALLGLLIILGAVTILSTINPNLVKLDVVGKGAPVTTTGSDVSKFAIDVKRGDEYDDFYIVGTCVNPSWIYKEVRNTTCYQERYDYLQRSCLANGGSKFVQITREASEFTKYQCQ